MSLHPSVYGWVKVAEVGDSDHEVAEKYGFGLLELQVGTCKRTYIILEDTFTTYLAIKATEYLIHDPPISL